MTRTLLVLGRGYTGTAIAALAAARGIPVTLTTRDPSDSAVPSGVRLIAFADAGTALATTTHVVSTIPPGEDGGDGDADDPAVAALGPALAAAPLVWAGYLSTTGVYGDRGGGWVSETTAPAPTQARSRRRLAAENTWAALGDRIAVDLFRVAGIYGPGRSPFAELRSGRGRRIVKPGHAFGRIHRDDIARAVLAAIQQDRPPGVRVLHLADDTPAEPAAVTEEAARLLGIDPPPAVPFAEAEARMSEMGRSFWRENRRIASSGTRAALGIDWLYPSYREGLAATLAEELADGRQQQ